MTPDPPPRALIDLGIQGSTDARWGEWIEAERAAIRAAGQWRAPRTFDARGPVGTLDGREVISFASNDYLGLTAHPAVVAAAHDALDRWGAGSGSARLIVGARPVHDELEHALAEWKGCEAAVLFPTGFAANLGAMTTFGGPGTLVASDELNHASIIDGCRLARGDVAIFRHRDADHLASLLAARGDRRALVVTDTVFSMDGDTADLETLGAVARDHDALVVVDEAHAVLGPTLDALADCRVLRIGTLSKTLGALGGFVAGDRAAIDLLVNCARSYIFTTAPTPADTAAALAAVRVLQSADGDALVARLRALVERVAPGHPSPIVTVHCGEEQHALDAAAAMLERGLLVPAIRPPTVAPGTSRLRITLCATHTDEQVDALLGALRDLELC